MVCAIRCVGLMVIASLFSCTPTDEPASDCMDSSTITFRPQLEGEGTYEVYVAPEGREGATCVVSHEQGQVASAATCTDTMTHLLNLESSSTTDSIGQREVARVRGISWYRISRSAHVTVRHNGNTVLDTDVSLGVTTGPLCDKAEAEVSIP